ncbi:FUSC family protein [Oceanicola sp. S124]|uniref:FUSC family protein n=1 Tax=Oceanicola sp. S124 TaxID=1042378 RepID=UPI000255851D|nr:FUSC family protein [Oceanicola sp. S124]
MTDQPPWRGRALQLFLAVAAALGLAWMLGLSHPFWAAMPVWVVSQPARQDLVIRAVLRVLGTMAGAGLGLLMLTHLDNPVLLVAGFALGVGVGTAAAFWIGTVYSYGALMAAITLGVVILPAVATPNDPWVLAVDRVWCTLIGVVAVTLATFAFTPRRDEKLPLRLNHGGPRALRNGALAMLLSGAGLVALLSTGQFWAMSAALSLTVFSTLMGAMPNPRPLIRYLPPATAIGIAAAIAYRLAGDHLGLGDAGLGELGLYLLALPFIACGAVLRAHPQSAPFGLDSNMCFLLTAEIGTAGHGLGAELQGGLAMLACGVLVAQIHRRLLPKEAATAT